MLSSWSFEVGSQWLSYRHKVVVESVSRQGYVNFFRVWVGYIQSIPNRLCVGVSWTFHEGLNVITLLISVHIIHMFLSLLYSNQCFDLLSYSPQLIFYRASSSCHDGKILLFTYLDLVVTSWEAVSKNRSSNGLAILLTLSVCWIYS